MPKCTTFAFFLPPNQHNLPIVQMQRQVRVTLGTGRHLPVHYYGVPAGYAACLRRHSPPSHKYGRKQGCEKCCGSCLGDGFWGSEAVAIIRGQQRHNHCGNHGSKVMARLFVKIESNFFSALLEPYFIQQFQIVICSKHSISPRHPNFRKQILFRTQVAADIVVFAIQCITFDGFDGLISYLKTARKNYRPVVQLLLFIPFLYLYLNSWVFRQELSFRSA